MEGGGGLLHAGHATSQIIKYTFQHMENMYENRATKPREWNKTMFSFRRIRTEPKSHSWVKAGYESIKALDLDQNRTGHVNPISQHHFLAIKNQYILIEFYGKVKNSFQNVFFVSGVHRRDGQTSNYICECNAREAEKHDRRESDNT